MTRPTASILHVDMDAFYASVEVLLDPSLAGRPLIVGGSARRGVVAAASYEARAFGVHSAMPSAVARRLCPHAVFVAGQYERYADVSRAIHAIFGSFTPVVEGIALDEAFLDVAGVAALFGSGPVIGQEIRRRIADEVGLSASVGVAGSKLVAKLASEAAKPRATRRGVVPGRGVVVVEPGAELEFLHPLPVDSLWGVGPVTGKRLHGLGVATIGDLAAVPLDTLVLTLGAAAGRHLHDLAWGRDARDVEPERATRSIGHEETYAWDRDDRDELHRELVRMADAVAARLRAAGLSGRTVSLKVRYGDFTTITRSRTLAASVDTGQAIARAAAALLDQVRVDPGVRLLGVSMANLANAGTRQLTFELGSEAGAVADPDPGADRDATGAGGPPVPATAGPEATDLSWQEATEAIDRVRARFGQGSVGPAVLVDDGHLRLKRQGDTQWGPAAERAVPAEEI